MTARTQSRHSRTMSAAYHALPLNVFNVSPQAVVNEFPTPAALLTRDEIALASGMAVSLVCGHVRKLMDKG